MRLFDLIVGSRKKAAGRRAPKVVTVYDPPPPFGGVRVSAAQTAELLRGFGGCDYMEVRYDSHPDPIPKVLFAFASRLLKSDAVLFLVGGFTEIARPRMLAHFLVAKLLGKPIIFRGFGGGLDKAFASLHPIRMATIFFAARRMALITFQTKIDVGHFANLLRPCKARIVWLPNTRQAGAYMDPQRERAVRFCFFGKVSRAKGVHLIVESAVGLPKEISIDIFGELEEGDEGQEIRNSMAVAGVHYRGSLPPEEIPAAMRTYDCLVFPTTWRTEGYPGVVLEAFAGGVPVIATRWNALPELVTEGCGILIEPGSSEALRKAILAVHQDPEGWRRMRRAALERMSDFDPERWTRKLHQWVADASYAGRLRPQPMSESLAGGT